MGTLTSLHMGRKQNIMMALYLMLSYNPKNALSAYELLLWQDVCCCEFCRNNSIVPSQGSRLANASDATNRYSSLMPLI